VFPAFVSLPPASNFGVTSRRGRGVVRGSPHPASQIVNNPHDWAREHDDRQHHVCVPAAAVALIYGLAGRNFQLSCGRIAC